MLSIFRAGEIDLFENLDIVHISLLVARFGPNANPSLSLPPTITVGPNRPIPELRFTLTDSPGELPTPSEVPVLVQKHNLREKVRLVVFFREV